MYQVEGKEIQNFTPLGTDGRFECWEKVENGRSFSFVLVCLRLAANGSEL